MLGICIVNQVHSSSDGTWGSYMPSRHASPVKYLSGPSQLNILFWDVENSLSFQIRINMASLESGLKV